MLQPIYIFSNVVDVIEVV